MRWVVLICGLALSLAVAAQEAPKKKKPAAKAKAKAAEQPVRGKPTPEQIRKFNELQKKQQP